MAGIARRWRRDPATGKPENGPLRAVAAVLAVGVAVLIVRCSGGSDTAHAAPGEAEIRAAAVKTLAARTAAVARHDRAGYLATDAPGGWFQAADGQTFDSLAALPLASWTMTLADDASAVPGAAHPHVYPVVESYQLSGIDFEPVQVKRYLTFVQHGSDWVVVSGRDAPAQHSDVALWDQGPVAVVHGARSLVIGLGGEQRLKPFADLADHAAAKAARIWGAAGWKGDVVVEVPSTQAQVEQLINTDAGSLQGVVAVTAGEGGKPVAGAPASRVLINPDAFNAESPDAWQFFLDHELTHVATRAWTTGQVPLWLSEGAADYTGYLNSGVSAAHRFQELADAVQAGWKPGDLPAAGDFIGSGTDVSRTYQISHLACAYIAEKYGQAKLVAFYKAVGTAEAGTPDPVDGAFHSVLGTTTKDFTTKWRAYVLTKAQAVLAKPHA